MRKRPFILPERKKKELPDMHSWGNLKNKYSGKTFFRAKLFELETGDLSVIDIVQNKWFFEELFYYSANSEDFNMLPSLRKIADTPRFDESMRQLASEIGETLEELLEKKKKSFKDLAGCNESEKAEYARLLLAGTRYPQTTEILRLLRDKSPELKRLAIYLIGKFKITDMIQEVCECFNIKGLENDAYAVLMSFGNMNGRDMDRCYLATAGNLLAGKAILRLLPKCSEPYGAAFLVERLWSTSRNIRETVLVTLLELKYKPEEAEAEKLKQIILEIFGILSWLISAKIAIRTTNDLLSAELDKEYERWKLYLEGLLSLTFGTTPSFRKKGKSQKSDEENNQIGILTRIIFENPVRSKSLTDTPMTNYLKKYRKLRPYFHKEIPSYNSLLEDIINCDYNLLTVWTKACALRSLSEIADEGMSQTIIALLFSPEELLREEAARLIARSGNHLYKKASGRLPESTREKLERIIGGDIIEKELFYEKVKFLVTSFGLKNEYELIPLAEKMEFARNDEKGIYSQPYNSIIWSFTEGKTEPDVIVKHEKNDDIREMVRDLMTSSIFCYMLPLNAVREYGFEYPENTYAILKYIDSIEE